MRATGNKRYLLWLGKMIRAEDHIEFKTVLEVLGSMPFFSLVPHDDNRALDGLGYRYKYKADTRREPFLGDCTVLEMLIALSERMSYIMYDPDIENEDQIHLWFWRLIHNLRIEPLDTYLDNLDKINVWLTRNYAPNGDGGLFPLDNPIEDQTKIEIWYQMMAYINEILF